MALDCMKDERGFGGAGSVRAGVRWRKIARMELASLIEKMHGELRFGGAFLLDKKRFTTEGTEEHRASKARSYDIVGQPEKLHATCGRETLVR